MPIFYLDASAITKFYLRDEIGVEFVIQLLELRSPDERIFTSALSVVEVKSAISRRIYSLEDREAALLLHMIATCVKCLKFYL